MGPSYSVSNDIEIMITRGNITLILKEATQGKEKEILKSQPEKLERKKRKKENMN